MVQDAREAPRSFEADRVVDGLHADAASDAIRATEVA